MKTIGAYYKILRHINIFQTFNLVMKIKHPRSASIRVLHRAKVYIHKTAQIILGEHSSLMINEWNTHIPTSQPCSICMEPNTKLVINGYVTLCEGAKIIMKAGG